MTETTTRRPGYCKAMIHPHTRQVIAVPYPCSRKVKTLVGLCKQHFKIAYKRRLVQPEQEASAP